MRIIALLPLLMVAACDVESDPQNDQVSLGYDEQQIENTAESVGTAAGEAASEVGNAAEAAASQLGNAASEAGQAIEDEVGDVDVDVDVNRNNDGDAN
ncbi:hypothetical protein [Sphingosinicella sp. CPCC 101087]|uniref:hypothetical protein n=1 Tax=Sphingosinicella sp. CPCC 101087 TaxID=2497754 RepID=UPI00101B8B68|nr:hypothetical protein [Sphingosinicella sp. CPCC 101087]